MSAETEPTDRAVLLLQRTRELLLDCRGVTAQLGASRPGQQLPAASAERIAGSWSQRSKRGSSRRSRTR